MTGFEAAAAPTLLKLAADLLRAIKARLQRGRDQRLVSAAIRELLSASPDIPRAEAALAEVQSKPGELFKALEMLKRAKKSARKAKKKKKRPGAKLKKPTRPRRRAVPP